MNGSVFRALALSSVYLSLCSLFLLKHFQISILLYLMSHFVSFFFLFVLLSLVLV